MLSGSNLVMLSLGVDAKLPELFIKVGHVLMNSVLDVAEVVVFKLLTLRCLSAEKGSSGVDKVLTLIVKLLVNEEIFLLGTYSSGNSCSIGTEELQNSYSLLGNNLH